MTDRLTLRFSRREVLAAAAAASTAVALAVRPRRALGAEQPAKVDFATLPAGDGWPGFTSVGVANLVRSGGEGLLEAGSDVFPNDPRPVAFAVDQRFRDGSVAASVSRTGAGAGVVVRRVSQRAYYAAVADSEQASLVLLRRSGFQVVELGRLPIGPVMGPLRLALDADGANPTSLRATLTDDAGRTVAVEARDGHPEVQGPGDAGVLATARTLFPSERNEALPALGNIHLLPYGVQEGQAFLESPAGRPILDTIRERSTAAFREITIEPREPVGPTVPSVVAATTVLERGRVVARVATDVPAQVSVEVSARADFRGARAIGGGATGAFEAVAVDLPESVEERVHWRARVRRGGREAIGPARSVAVPPRAGAREPVRIAVGACASQFGPIFDRLAERRPDVMIWQGDLNYPDTHGPLAQTLSGYAGIWRDFLGNPRMAPLLERGLFVARRDDHDYGVQDANSENLPAFGLAPWDALMGEEPFTRFSAGLLDVWVLDQRRFKTPPGQPDGPGKTLLGPEQRAWLERTLAASSAPFKLICSPCTLSPAERQNSRDGNWSSGFVAERTLLLRHIAERVSGTTLFVSGDTHFTMVHDDETVFEARACPLDIPTPNDVTISEPDAAEKVRAKPGVAYADDEHGHVAIVETRANGDTAVLDLALLRPDGTTPYTRRFEERLSTAASGREERRRPRRRNRSASGTPGDEVATAGTGAAESSAPGSSPLPFTGGQASLVALAGGALAAAGAAARRLARGGDEVSQRAREDSNL